MVFAQIPFMVLALVHWPNLPAAQSGDYAQYLLHAKALVEGRPYGDIGYLFTAYNPFIGPPNQLPGWSILLSPGVAFFGSSLVYGKVLVIASGAGLIAFITLRLGRGENRWIAALVGAIAGVTIESGFATINLLSDLPFACMVWATFCVADKPEEWSWTRAVTLGLLVSAAISTRIIGVALVPGLALLALRRTRPDRMKILTLLVVWGIAGLSVLILARDRIPFITEAFSVPFSDIAGRLRILLPRTRFGFLEGTMYPFPWDIANDAYHIGAVGLCILGLRRTAKSIWGSLVATTAPFYLLIIAVAPVFDIRYLWPIWPLVAYAMINGASFVLERVTQDVRRACTVSLGLFGALTAAALFTGLVREPPPALLNQTSVLEVFDWVRRAQLRDSVRVVFVSPRVLTLETGVPAMGPFAADREATLRELERVRISHVIVGDVGIGSQANESLGQVVRSNPADFRLEYQNEGFQVYEVRGGPSGASQ